MACDLTRDKAFFAFSPDTEPVVRVAQGEELHLTTHDCFSGQLKTTADTLETLDWSITNPATGPVYIEGTKPGDLLRVDLHEVKAHGPLGHGRGAQRRRAGRLDHRGGDRRSSSTAATRSSSRTRSS